jgi:hypothetical protein
MKNTFRLFNEKLKPNVCIQSLPRKMEQIGKHISFDISNHTGAAPTHGTIIGYIVQTDFTDEGISLPWYDSGSTPNIVIGIIPKKYTANKIHKTYTVEKLKVD